METTGIIAITAAFAIAACTVFPALSQGKTAVKALESIARQPEAGGDLRTAMIIALAMMEALTIYGLLIAIMIVGKI